MVAPNSQITQQWNAHITRRRVTTVSDPSPSDMLTPQRTVGGR